MYAKNIILKAFSLLLIVGLMMAVLPAGKAEANDTSTSTIVFESNGGYTLTDNGDGTYSGVIPCKEGGGFDIYAKEGAAAFIDGDIVTIANHDAWSAWNPDTPDWYQYSLSFYEEGGVQKWALRNHAGATEIDPWYGGSNIARGVPLSGIMNWGAMYAAETEVGVYLPGTGTPESEGLAASNGGGAGYWDMDWSWGSEAVPLEYPGFDVNIEDIGSGNYRVTFTPAAGPVKNLTTNATYGTIQSAIDAASNGDTIFIGAGRYKEIASNGTIKPNTLGKMLDFVGETDGSGNPLPVIEGSLIINLNSGMNDNVIVNNLNFEVTITDTLRIFGVNGITIDNCTFDGGGEFNHTYMGVHFVTGSGNGNSDATITNSIFKDGFYGAIQGYVNGLTVEDSDIYNVKSGINHMGGGGNLVVNNTDISVEAQSAAENSYAIRFPSSSVPNMTISGGSYTVDKNGLTANSGVYHSAIIIRDGATGTLKVNGASIYGEVVNLSDTLLDATGNWWGSASGPAEGQIIEDEDAGDVIVCPWLNAEGGVSTYPVNNTTSGGGFCTIQAAIDSASNGDHIDVMAGNYDETINIENFSGLSISGEDPSTTIIKSSSTLPWNVGTYGSSRQTVLRVVDSTNVAIKNLTFDLDLVKGNYTYAGLFSDSTGNVEENVFKNNQVPETSGGYYELGLALRAPGYNDSSRAAITVKDNIFQDLGRVSLHLGNYVETTITGNTFYKTADDFGYGIELGTQSSGIISDNIFYGFDTPAASDNSNSAAIYVENCFTSSEVNPIIKNVTISGNQIYNNQWGIYIGNQFDGYAGNVDIVLNQTGNNIYDNTDGGVFIADEDKSAGSSVSVTGSNNVITNNGEYGYYIATDGDGDVTVNLTGETITGQGTGVIVEDTGTTSTSSYSIAIGGSDLSNNTINAINNTVAGLTINASPNWWGSPCGPTNVVGDVTYSPWYVDKGMTTTATASAYDIPSGVTTTEINAVLACAAPDATITFQGTAYSGGLVVDNDDLTFNLNGATVGAGSPAFTINGDNITIQGPGTLDGNGSTDPGILVNAGADNFILDGVEVTEWADGVQVAGAVESLKIVNNWMHNNTDAGLQVDADLTGIVTIEGNLFKANGGFGVTTSGSSLEAEYNSWGDLAGPAGTNGDGVGANVDAVPFTFVEFFMDVDPDDEALTRNVDESTSFDVKLNADAADLYGLSFKLTYDDEKLHLNSQTFSAPWASRCEALTSGAGEIAYRCTLITTAWSADGGDILTLNFTATGSGLTGNGPWDALFDISHLATDASAGAYGGAKVYVNNAGYGAPSVTERDITDADDGKVTIGGIAQFTGFVDLQGRANDAGATLAIYNQQLKSGSTLLANATSSSSGGYTTSYISPNLLTVGTEYWLFADAWLYLPTTMTSATGWANSDTLTTRPKTDLATLVLLGGDATNNDEIEVLDATCIGGNYNGTGVTCGTTGWTDVNGDGAVDILDLVMMGTNYDKKYSPWNP